MSGTHDYDRKYLSSIAGICKFGCLLCSLVGILCILWSSVRISNFRGSCYLSIASLGFLATLALLGARFQRLWQRQFCRCNATLWEFYVHTALAVAYFVASGLVLSLSIGSYTAAAFFGLTAFTINALEAYASYRRSIQREVATQTA